jgi:hypothetical protein
MDFFKLLQSLDDLLYEVMSWLVFYPVTLWRTLRKPRDMMDYAVGELGKAEDAQFNDAMSPPLFLFVTLMLSHAIELAVVGEASVVNSHVGLSSLIDNDTNLILMRVAMFSLFPLIMATRLVRKQRIGLNRETLRAPFYSQCYTAAPFALLLGLAAIVVRMQALWLHAAGVLMVLVGFAWYGGLQVGWFARHLGISRWRGLLQASIGMLEGVAAMAAMGWIFA